MSPPDRFFVQNTWTGDRVKLNENNHLAFVFDTQHSYIIKSGALTYNIRLLAGVKPIWCIVMRFDVKIELMLESRNDP